MTQSVFEIGLSHYLALSGALFSIGFLGLVLNRRNVIVFLMAVELMLLAANLNFVAFARAAGDMTGQVFAMIVLTVAAAESAVALAILVVFWRARGSSDIDDFANLKG